MKHNDFASDGETVVNLPQRLQELPPDRLDAGYRAASSGQIMGPLLVGMVAANSMGTLAPDRPATAIATGIGMGLATERLEKWSRKKAEAEAITAQATNEQLSSYVGRQAEYYRGDKAMYMLYAGVLPWHARRQAFVRVYDAPADDQSSAVSDQEAIRRLSHLHRAAPAFTDVIMSSAMAQRLGVPKQQRVFSGTARHTVDTVGKFGIGSVSDVLFSEYPADDGQNMQVVRVSAKILDTLAERNTELSVADAQRYLALLKQYKPMDPMVRKLQGCDPANAKHREVMRRIVTNRIERDISDTAVQVTSSVVDPARETLHIRGHVKRAKQQVLPPVQLHDQHYRPVLDNRSILDLRGGGDVDSLKASLDDAHATTKDKFEAATTLLFLKLHEIQLPSHTTPQNDITPPFQQTLLEKGRAFRTRKVLRGLVGGLAVVGAAAILQPLEHSLNHNPAVVAAEERLETIPRELSKLVPEGLRGKSPSSTWSPTTSPDFLLGDQTDSLSAVGDNIKNSPQWYIKSRGDMSGVGYWGVDTLNKISHDFTKISNSLDVPYSNTKQKLPPEADVPTDIPSVRVWRPIELEESNPESGYDLAIPVLEGTELLAAQALTYTDTVLEVTAYQNIQGNTRLRVPHHADLEGDRVIELSYVLVPQTLPEKALPHRVEPMGVEVVDSEGDPVPSDGHPTRDNTIRPIQSVADVWRPYLEVDPMAPTAIDQHKSYIQNDLLYALSSPPEGEYDSEQAYAASLLESDVAKCNTAAVLLALTYPDQLAVAVGYHNGGNTADSPDGEATLSLMEGHAWNVNGVGTRYDATPRTFANPDEQAAFVENYQAQPKPPEYDYTWERILIGGGLALGLFGVTGPSTARATRRKITQASRNRTMYKLRETSLEEVNQAYSLLSSLAWAASDQLAQPTTEQHATSRRQAIAMRKANLPRRVLMQRRLFGAEAKGHLDGISPGVLKTAKILSR